MLTTAQLKALADLAIEDPDATINERDAAFFVRKQSKTGLAVPTDVADVLQRYQGRQLQQNRWGK
jgi:hypothetical protein